MAAVVTVGGTSDLIQRFITLLLSGPLPWVFDTIGEENVGNADVPAALIDGSLCCAWLLCHALAE